MDDEAAFSGAGLMVELITAMRESVTTGDNVAQGVLDDLARLSEADLVLICCGLAGMLVGILELFCNATGLDPNSVLRNVGLLHAKRDQ